MIEPLKQFFLESNVVPSLAIGAIRKLKRKFTMPPALIRKAASKTENEQLDRMIKQLELKRAMPGAARDHRSRTRENPDPFLLGIETKRAEAPTGGLLNPTRAA